MSLLVDRREPDDAVRGLRTLGSPADSTMLAFGDYAWLGNGPGGRPVPVGVERKRLRDLLNCISGGRFAADQLPGLAAAYEERWLLVEGDYRPNPKSGELEERGPLGWRAVEIGQRRYQFRDVEHWLTTQEMLGGMRLRRSLSVNESLRTIAALHSWWTAKDWEEHRSHLALKRRDFGPLLARPSLIRRIAAELPGIGLERSGAVAATFGSVRRMVLATAEEWQAIEGIGSKTAAKLVEVLG